MARLTGRPGPDPKGLRGQFTGRAPTDHLERYREEAQKAGLPLGDYLAATLALAHGLAVPDYISRPKAQEELPLGA